MKFRTALLSLLMIAIAPLAFAEDVETIVSGCADCHGEGGVSKTPEVPNIGGVAEFVLLDNMLIFQDKARPCRDVAYPGDDAREPANKCEMFADFTEAQIEAIAQYYDAKPFVAHPQETDPALVSVGQQIHEASCEKCHTEGGSVKEDEAGILAGQWMPYLRQQLEDYAAGEREMPEKMADKMESLSEEQLEALVHYYGSLGVQ